MGSKKNPILDEIEGATLNYVDGIDTLKIQGRNIRSLRDAAKRHEKNIELGQYGFESLLLEQAYIGLSSNSEEARDAFVKVAAIAAVVIEKIDSNLSDLPAAPVEEPVVEDEDEQDEAPADDESVNEVANEDLDPEAFSHASEAFADLADE